MELCCHWYDPVHQCVRSFSAMITFQDKSMRSLRWNVFKAMLPAWYVQTAGFAMGLLFFLILPSGVLAERECFWISSCKQCLTLALFVLPWLFNISKSWQCWVQLADCTVVLLHYQSDLKMYSMMWGESWGARGVALKCLSMKDAFAGGGVVHIAIYRKQ